MASPHNVQRLKTGFKSSSSVSRLRSSHRQHSTLSAFDHEAWNRLGIPNTLVDSLNKSFTRIKSPSDVQVDLIPAILNPPTLRKYEPNHKDVILKASTGTGKSFGIAIALVAKAMREAEQMSARTSPGSPAMSLVLVPHRELAYQYKQWIDFLHPNGGSGFAQLCIKGDPLSPLPTHLFAHLSSSRFKSVTELIKSEVKPAILLATPTGLANLLQYLPSLSQSLPKKFPFRTHQDPVYDLYQSLKLSTVVADEFDSMLSLPSQYAPRSEFYQWNRHKPPICSVLDVIYGMPTPELDVKRDSRKRSIKYTPIPSTGISERGLPTQTGIIPRPQLVLTSATLNVPVRRFLFQHTGWMKQHTSQMEDRASQPNMITRLEYPGGENRMNQVEEGTNTESAIRHSCIVVSPSEIVTTLRELSAEERELEKQQAEQKLHAMTNAERKALKQENAKNPTTNPSTKAPSIPSKSILGAIATAVAIDVPKLALLIIPNTSSVVETMSYLKDLGVTARKVDRDTIAELSHKPQSTPSSLSPSSSITGSRGEPDLNDDDPTLLITIPNAIRGLDFPTLTHVFILDPVSTCDKYDTYKHIAGRVGRFGQGGKVISVVEGGENNEGASDPSGITDGQARVTRERCRAWGLKLVPFDGIQ